MVVKLGYKQTEMGVTPEDWDVKQIGNIAEVIMGQSPVGSSYNQEGLGIPLINGPTEFTDKYPIKRQWTTEPTKLCKNGDMLLCVRGSSTGRFNISDDKYCIGRGVAAIRAKPGSNTKYIIYQIDSNIQKLLLYSAGSTFPNVDGKSIRSITIPFPPTIKEQQAIATALSGTDALITGLERLIEKKRNIKKGAMQELLIGKRRLSGFTEEWGKSKLIQLTSMQVTDGPHLTPRFLKDGVPFLSVNNIVNNKIDWTDLRYISKSNDEEFSKKCKPQKRDILFGKAATVGTVAIVESDIDFNIWSPLALIRINNKHIAKFFYYCLQTSLLFRQIKLFTNSSSQGNIGMRDIEKLEFPIPTKQEQTAIAQVLSDMDAEIEALEMKLAKYHDIKKGMMQELLTGKMRLV